MKREKVNENAMYRGRIITPDNMGVVLVDVKSMEIDSYGIQGWMSEKMRKAIEKNSAQTGWRFNVFSSNEGQKFFVATVQAGASQARFLMHLSDERVLQMLRWSQERCYMQIMLAVPRQVGLFHFRPRFTSSNIQDILKEAEKCNPVRGANFILNMTQAADELKGDVSALTCGDMPRVNDVCINSILWNGNNVSERHDVMRPEKMH